MLLTALCRTKIYWLGYETTHPFNSSPKSAQDIPERFFLCDGKGLDEVFFSAIVKSKEWCYNRDGAKLSSWQEGGVRENHMQDPL